MVSKCCCPWELSCCETFSGLVPGLGFFTSIIGWGWRRRQITEIDLSIDIGKIVGSTPCQGSPYETLLAPHPGNRSLERHRPLLVAKKLNCTALFALNAVYILAFVVLYIEKPVIKG